MKTRRGEFDGLKGEVIVSNTLEYLNLDYEYEKPLHNPDDPSDFRLPDFTITWKGETYYWEHLGMLGDSEYERKWEEKLQWYIDCGFGKNLIYSRDASDGSIDAREIEQIARMRIMS